MCLVIFFSSRRRHTRFDCDWSSDVCSSDLVVVEAHLHVQREHPAVLGDDERVDLDHRGVELAEGAIGPRSEEHTSELQSQSNLVCRLLLEKKKQSLLRFSDGVVFVSREMQDL